MRNRGSFFLPIHYISEKRSQHMNSHFTELIESARLKLENGLTPNLAHELDLIETEIDATIEANHALAAKFERIMRTLGEDANQLIIYRNLLRDLRSK